MPTADTATVDLLSRLIAFDTVSSNSNLELIEFVEAFLNECNFQVKRLTDTGGQKAGLFAKLGSGDGGFLLSAHSDVVPAKGQNWTKDPFRLTSEKGKLFGRGTTDMKGFLASMLNAADKASRLKLREPLSLAISYDEEIGCVGIANMIDDLVPAIGRPRGCVVGEPTGMRVAIGHKGKVAFRGISHGQTGHSAMAPLFVNAIHMAADFVQALRDVQAWLEKSGAQDDAYDVPYSTVHVGKLSGGLALNMVPDRAELAFEFRHLAADSPADLFALIEEAALTATRPYAKCFPDARIELHQEAAYPGLETPADALIVEQVRDFAGTRGTIKVPFGTEAGFFDGLGIPTVVCGPGSMEGQGHKLDEFLEADQLSACDEMLERLVQSLT